MIIHTLTGANVATLGRVRRTMLSTKAAGSVILLDPAKSNGALTFLLPLLAALASRSGGVRTIVVTPSHRLTLRVRAMFHSLKTKCGIGYYCKKRPVHARGGDLRRPPAILVNAPKHVISRLRQNGVGLSDIHALVLSRFSGSLRLNFLTRVGRVLTRLPNIHHQILASTATTISVPTFAKVATPMQLSFLGRIGRSGKLTLHIIGSPIGSGLRALCGLLNRLGNNSTLVFYGCQRAMRQIDGCLARVNMSGRCFRKKVRRPRHRHTLSRFHGNDTAMFVSASLTSHNLSVPRIGGIVRCRLPIDRRTCIRHGKHATHVGTRKITCLVLGTRRAVPRCVAHRPSRFFLPRITGGPIHSR